MAIRRSLSDQMTDQESDPAIDAMLLPPDIAMTGGGAGGDQPQQQNYAQYVDRAPADISYMDVQPNFPGVQGIVAGDRVPPPVPPAGPVRQTSGATPAGYDPTKWNTANYDSDKYRAGHIIASGGSIEQAAAAVHGTVVGKDLIMMPNGEVYDAIFDVGGANAPMWEYQYGGSGPGTHAQGQAAGAGAGAGAGSGPPSGINYAPPGDSGVYGGDLLQQVGQDPFSQLITSVLTGLMERGGNSPFGADLQSTLQGMIGRGGELDEGVLNRRLESARESENQGFRAQLNDARAALASRGLLSEPGQPSGAETGSVRRISEGLAPEYARTIRDIHSDEAERSDSRLLQSLSLATGLAQDQASNLLAAAGAGTQRQAVLADIALRSLDQNMQWNQFLATYGLSRDKLLYDIRAGNQDSVMPILAMFLQLLNASRGGYVDD